MTEPDLQIISHTPICFIMGRERSGTTLLQVMLNTHPNIVAPPESRFVMMWYSRYGSVTSWNEKLIRRFVGDIYTERLFANFWNIKKENLIESLLDVKEKLNYPLLCRLIYYYAALQGKHIKMFSDKNPIYCHFLHELPDIFPGSKYIHLIRDYRDNILSSQKIFATKSAAYIAYHWVHVNEMIEEAKKKAPEKWITLTYETLVTDPVASLISIYKFLGLPFDESIIKPHEENIPQSFHENISNPRLTLFHKNLFKPLDASLIGQWKEKMNAKDLNMAEAIAGEVGENVYSYKRQLGNKAKVGSLNLLKAKLTYAAMTNLIRMAIKRPWVYSALRRFWLKFIKTN